MCAHLVIGPISHMVKKCASLVPRPRDFFGYTKENHRAWYLKSRDQLSSLSDSKDGCVSLCFTGDFVSAVSLWHKRAVKEKLQV